MRLRRIYLRVSLGGFALLALKVLVFALLGGAAPAGGFLGLTYYWIILCIVVGLLLLLMTGLRRFANRIAKPS